VVDCIWTIYGLKNIAREAFHLNGTPAGSRSISVVAAAIQPEGTASTGNQQLLQSIGSPLMQTQSNLPGIL